MPRASKQPPSGPDGPLFDAASPPASQVPGSNLPEIGVGELSRLVRDVVQGAFPRVRIRGEIGECKLHASGHLYLSLKEGTDVLAAVCWRGQVARLGIRPATGMEVVAIGKLTTYGGQSKYQLVVEQMELAGAGALLKMLEERKARLSAEGLFEAARKKPLPFLPEVIGVVTSPTGAVIRDILHRLADRFPRRVLVWPVAVQGPGSAEQVAAAIRGFNALPEGGAVPRPDVLIVARGGGSLEDLMPFNEEVVVRAAADSRIPLISAVGHETDVTLIDFAADQRAPTPTAAAEMAVPVRADLVAMIRDRSARLDQGWLRFVRQHRESLDQRARRLGDPARALEPLMQRFDDRAERLTRSLPAYVARIRTRFDRAGTILPHMFAERVRNSRLRFERIIGKIRDPRVALQVIARKLDGPAAKLEALSPRAVMKRGYALVYDEAGQVVKEAAHLKRGQKVTIELQDAARHAAIED